MLLSTIWVLREHSGIVLSHLLEVHQGPMVCFHQWNMNGSDSCNLLQEAFSWSSRFTDSVFAVTHLLACICNPKSLLTALSWSLVGICTWRGEGWEVGSPGCTRSQLRPNRAELSLLVSALTQKTSVLSAVWVVLCFSQFCASCGFCCLKWPQT